MTPAWTVASIEAFFHEHHQKVMNEMISDTKWTLDASLTIRKIQARYRGMLARREVMKGARKCIDDAIAIASWAKKAAAEKKQTLIARHEEWRLRSEPTISWLKAKTEILERKIADKSLGLNWIPDPQSAGWFKNLGAVPPSWCFSFKLKFSGENMDTDAVDTDAVLDFTLTDDTEIPLQAYQIIHQMLVRDSETVQ